MPQSKCPGGAANTPGPGQPTEEAAVNNSTAPEPHPSTDDRDEHPHVCNDGWVSIGQAALDPETGEEVEEYALYLCRRCASEAPADAAR